MEWEIVLSSPAYIAGDPWRICDRCGFKYRSSQTFKTWDGLFVCWDDFETRHPQDFVRGRKDQQTAPEPRPEQIETIVGPLTTNITTAAASGDFTIHVESSIRFLMADKIGVMLDNGDLGKHTIQSVPTGTSIQLTTALGGHVSVNSIVINYSAVSVADIG